MGHPGPVRVHDEDLAAGSGDSVGAEGDSLAVGGPNGINVASGVVRELGDSAAVGVHHINVEVAIAVAVEGDGASEALCRGHAELRRVHRRRERSLGVLTVGEKSTKGEERDEA